MEDGPFAGFHSLKPEGRIRRVSKWAGLDASEQALLRRTFQSTPGLPPATADGMSENVVGVLGLPLGVATNFRINGKEYLVPMAVEEPSIVAAASHAAKMARARGGFAAEASDPLMIGQIHLEGVREPEAAAAALRRKKKEILRAARVPDSALEKNGGGPVDWEVRAVRGSRDAWVTCHLLIDVGDAMGANAVNTRCERVAPLLEELTGGQARLRIVSNLADRRLARAKATFSSEALGGKDVVERVLSAYRIAQADPYRCATHNKGVMNGVDALAVATGNDWRALEAGAHAYAARNGRYESLTQYATSRGGDLVGTIELPVSMGTLGGSTRANPVAAIALKMLRVGNARELAQVAACVGLAQNLAALRALVTEGVQTGHMRLHKRIER